MIVGEASVVIKYDSGAAAAELKATTDADLAGLSDAAAVAGTQAGEDLRKGVKEGTDGIAADAADAGALAGVDQAGQTTTLANDSAALSAAQAAATAAQQTAQNTATIASSTAAAAAALLVNYYFNLEGSGQTTTADWMTDISVAMMIGTLPPAVPNPGLPGNQVLVAG